MLLSAGASVQCAKPNSPADVRHRRAGQLQRFDDGRLIEANGECARGAADEAADGEDQWHARAQVEEALRVRQRRRKEHLGVPN